MNGSPKTINASGCILYAEEATDVLKTELGAACSKFKTEDQYLLGILKIVRGIEKNPEAYLDDWNLLDEIDLKVFKIKLRSTREHIEKTIKIPLKDRGNR